MSLQRSFSLAVAALSMVVLAGCQNSTPPAASSTMAPPQKVIVVTTNSGRTSIFIPTDDPNKPMMLSTAGGDVCPECQAAAVKYFKTGVLDPKCSLTGATRTVANLVEPPTSTGHQ